MHWRSLRRNNWVLAPMTQLSDYRWPWLSLPSAQVAKRDAGRRAVNKKEVHTEPPCRPRTAQKIFETVLLQRLKAAVLAGALNRLSSKLPSLEVGLRGLAPRCLDFGTPVCICRRAVADISNHACRKRLIVKPQSAGQSWMSSSRMHMP